MSAVDDYMAALPDDVRPVLEDVRSRLHAAVPGATETVKYAMPTLEVGGRSLVHFAGWKRHVSLYPAPPDPSPELAPYCGEKGTVKFPLLGPVPAHLVEEIGTKLLASHGGVA